LTRKTQHPTNRSVTWTEGDTQHAPELLAIIFNQLASRLRLREHGERMSIEQSLRDDQSGGFDMQHSRLQIPAQLERLLLALAIATLWCHELGEFVLAEAVNAVGNIRNSPFPLSKDSPHENSPL
jgi:hypothetical protein